MRILLVGEYSGLFNCLKDGLLKLGHEVFLISRGDGYRNYPSDYRWDKHINLGIRLNVWLDLFNVIRHLSLFRGYDVVMFVSTRVFSYPSFPNRYITPFINKWLIKFIIKNNKKSFICDSGLDYIGYQYWFNQKGTKYFDYTHVYDPNGNFWLMNKKAAIFEDEIRQTVTGCIPIWYEYAQPYRHYSNLRKAIRIPINIEKFQYRPNIVNGRIVFFHGLSRACKGGEYIQKAFDRMREKYNDIAEFICAGGLPFDEYMKITSRANVILDDINSYSFAMNALFAMSRGIIYMGGAEPEGNLELGYEDCPAINLTKDVNQICDAIEYVIKNKDKIEEMGLASRNFVEKYHSHVKIAQQYIDCWNEK